MQINKHGSFYLRNGWPTKIIEAVNEHPYIFSPASELQAIDEIGVGRVMVKAMRYWAYVTGITIESKDAQGVLHKLSDLGNNILQYDLYCQDKGTLWLMHRNLARNYSDSTVWAWAFNSYGRKTFSKDDFVTSFIAYVNTNHCSYKKAFIEKEFDCFKNTYVSDKKFDLKKILDEDNIPFFSPLGLIVYIGNGKFEKQKIDSKDIPSDIALYCILKDNKDHLQSQHQIDIDTLLNGDMQIGRYMNLTYSSLLEVLQLLENEGKLSIVNNFGYRYIQIDNLDTDNLLYEYYQRIAR